MSHQWDDAGERCLKCGDKDWFAGPECDGDKAIQGSPLLDNCQVCGGSRGGVPGNENIIDGTVMCDYCSAERMKTPNAETGRVDYRAFGHASVEWFAGCPEPGTVLYTAPPDLAAENYKLRMLLFAAHGARPGCLLYGDDGERTCNSCGIDFVRDSVADIERKVHERGMRELEKLVAEGKWPPNDQHEARRNAVALDAPVGCP